MDFNQLMAKMRELDVAEEIKDEEVEAPVEETAEETVEPAVEETAEETEEAVEEETIEEEPVDECPGEMSMGPEAHDEPKPTMNVTMTAQGVDEIGELMKLFTKVNPDMINQPDKPMDMPKIVKLPLDMDDEKEEAYSNEPDEVKHSDNIHDGNDLNKKKGTYPKVAGGDNPMQDMRESIKAELQARLAELKGAK